MLGLPNNDKDFMHTQVGKIGLGFLTLKHLKSQRVYNHLHCLDCLTIIKNQHTHTHVDQNPNFRIVFNIQF
jgi:hypothetical protein